MLRSATKPRIIGITLGDPAGIGPEVTARALASLSLKDLHAVVIGDRASFTKHLKRIPKGISMYDVPFKGNLRSGQGNRQTGAAALEYLDLAVRMAQHGLIDAIVTAPLSKELVSLSAPGFVGHTEYLANAFGVKQYDMMFVAPHIRLVIATRHDAINRVPKLITKARVGASIELLNKTLKAQFGVRKPRIAVLGLNPHAGENGLIGREDTNEIVPAIKAARAKGVNATGPFAADTFFINIENKGFDGIIAMYHDQGLIPIKTLYSKQLVNFTSGLPFVRTSPAHGTGFDIAGKNKADASSMKAAVTLAFELS